MPKKVAASKKPAAEVGMKPDFKKRFKRGEFVYAAAKPLDGVERVKVLMCTEHWAKCKNDLGEIRVISHHNLFKSPGEALDFECEKLISKIEDLSTKISDAESERASLIANLMRMTHDAGVSNGLLTGKSLVKRYSLRLADALDPDPR
jgi:hypothetical protein